MAEGPTDPFGNIGAGAVQLHEYYQSFKDSGFTAEEAMQLILTMMNTTLRHALGKTESDDT